MTNKERYEQRKALGICVDCCGALDQPEKYVRCPTCREYHTNASKDFRQRNAKPKPEHPLKEQAMKLAEKKAMKEAAQQMVEDSKAKRRAEKCLRCEWGTHMEGTTLCPFPEGGCMKQ